MRLSLCVCVCVCMCVCEHRGTRKAMGLNSLAAQRCETSSSYRCWRYPLCGRAGCCTCSSSGDRRPSTPCGLAAPCSSLLPFAGRCAPVRAHSHAHAWHMAWAWPVWVCTPQGGRGRTDCRVYACLVENRKHYRDCRCDDGTRREGGRGSERERERGREGGRGRGREGGRGRGREGGKEGGREGERGR